MGLIPALAEVTARVDPVAAALWNTELAKIRTAVNNTALFTDVNRTVTATVTFSTSPVFSAAVSVPGLTVSTGGIAVTGNSTITGTLGGLTGLTVTSGGFAVTGASSIAGALTVSTGGIAVTGNSTITGTLGGLTGLTVASGGITVTGNSTITGGLSGVTGFTCTSLTVNGSASMRAITPQASATYNLGGEGAVWATVYANALAVTTAPTFVGLTTTGDTILGASATITGDEGFVYVSTIGGEPASAPSAQGQRAVITYDSTNNKLYVCSAAGVWSFVSLTPIEV